MKPEHVARLNSMVNGAPAEESFKKSTAAKGMDAVGSTPQALQSFIAEETGKWRGVIRKANIRLN